MKETVKPTSIRLENDLLIKVQADAEKERRSVSKQIEYMLLQYYELKKLLNR